MTRSPARQRALDLLVATVFLFAALNAAHAVMILVLLVLERWAS